jgi:inosine-uridine nucleoside N-ribohydrolase
MLEIVFLGGVFRRSGNFTPVAETNVFADPEAASAVFQSGARIRIVPLDVSEQLSIDARAFEALSSSQGTLLQQYLSVIFGPLLAYYRVVFNRNSCPIHDPLAVALGLHPQLFQLRHMAVTVELNGTLTRGVTVIDERPEAELDNLQSPIQIVEKANLQAVRDLLADVVGIRNLGA